MKRNLDKPDYRSMNEAKLKLELAGLEQRILGITGDSLDYQHYRRFLDWSRNEMKVFRWKPHSCSAAGTTSRTMQMKSLTRSASQTLTVILRP